MKVGWTDKKTKYEKVRLGNGKIRFTHKSESEIEDMFKVAMDLDSDMIYRMVPNQPLFRVSTAGWIEEKK